MSRSVHLAWLVAALLVLCSCDQSPNRPPKGPAQEASQALGAEVTGGSEIASGSDVYSLSSLGSLDWAHWGSQGFVRKAGANQISDATLIGGARSVKTGTPRHASWTGGSPTASASDDQSCAAVTGTSGQGFSFTVAASTATRKLTVFWGGSAVDGARVRLVAHLNDGSAPDLVVTRTNGVNVSAYLTTINFTAASNTTLRVSITRDDAIAGRTVDLKAAWLSPTASSPDTRVNFEDTADGATLGSYAGITWGSQNGGFRAWNGGAVYSMTAYLDSPSTTEVSATLTLPAGQVLKSLRIASNEDSPATVKLSAPGNPERTFTNIRGGYVSRGLGWTTASSVVTIKITCNGKWGAADVVFDDIVYGPPVALPTSDTTLTFEDSGDGAFLSAYGGIYWGSGNGEWKTWDGGPYTYSLFLNQEVTSEVISTFTLPAGVVLKSVKIASAESGPATVKISAAGNPERVWSDIASAYQTKTLDWTTAASVVTVKISCTGKFGAAGVYFDDLVFGPASVTQPPTTEDPEDGIDWEPLPVEQSRAMRDAFRWDQTSALSEVSPRSYTVGTETIALPPMHYALVYARNPDELRELEEIGIHFDLAPLFQSEWPAPNLPVNLPYTGDLEQGGQFVFALIPAQIYNAIRAESLAGVDTYRAVILRSVPSEARAADGTVSWDVLLGNLQEYAPITGEYDEHGVVVPPVVEVDDTVAATQKRIGRRLRKFARRVVSGARWIRDGVGKAIAETGKFFTKDAHFEITTSIKNHSRAPLVRGWDDGNSGFGRPLRLEGGLVKIRGALGAVYSRRLDKNGATRISTASTFPVRVCFVADTHAAKIEGGIARAWESCKPFTTPVPGANPFPARLTKTEYHALAQITDAHEYANRVLGYDPPKATIQGGAILDGLGFSTGAFVPCLAATNAPVRLVHQAFLLLETYAPAPHSLAEFLYSTDIFMDPDARRSRSVPVHEYGHFVFCTLLNSENKDAFSTVWTQVTTLENFDDDATTSVKALNEGFADWFASQVVGAVNYFSMPDSVEERGDDFMRGAIPDGSGGIQPSAAANGGGLEANFGGPGCSSDPVCMHGACRAQLGCHIRNNPSNTGGVISRVASILYDAIDRGDCGTDQTCIDGRRNDGSIWNPTTSPFTTEMPYRLDDVLDETVALTPRDIADAVRTFANSPRTTLDGLTYEQFDAALIAKMREKGSYDEEICHLYAIHSETNDCAAQRITRDRIAVIFRAELVPPFPGAATQGGFVRGVPFNATTCDAVTCGLPEADHAILKAEELPGFKFSHWSDCSTSTDPVLFLKNLRGWTSCVAHFTPDTPKVHVAFSAGNGGVVTAAAAAPGVCNVIACTVDVGGSVALTATPGPGFTFTAWSGCSAQTNATLTLGAVTSNQNCRANFAPVATFTVTATANGGGSARPPSTTVTAGGSVVLEAVPNAGQRFVSWSGAGCVGTTATITIASVNANLNCVANFAPLTYTVRAVANNGSGGTATPPSTTVNLGAGTTLEARPNAGWRFVNWTGPAAQCNSTNASLVILNVTADVTCTANFQQLLYDVRATAGTGGTVDPPVITAVHNQVVTIRARPNAGFGFVNWSGGGPCVGTNPALTITVTSNVNCRANFAALVTVTARASAGGTVTPTTASVVTGGSVSLQASANNGFRFVNWSGSAQCAGTNPTLTIAAVTGNLTCTANFAAFNYTVTATAGTGGSVSPTSTTVGAGGSVTLRATPSSGFRFLNWSGSAQCSGTSATLSISPVNSNVSCAATFSRNQVSVSFSASPSTSGSVTASNAPTGSCSGSTCTFAQGSSVTLTARPNTSAFFLQWTGCSTSTNPVLTLSNVQANLNCVAVFSRTYRVTYSANRSQVTVSAAVRFGPACSGGVCTVPEGGGVDLSADTTGFYYVDRWTCVEESTGRLISSENEPSPAYFALIAIQSNWTCQAVGLATGF